MRDAGLAHAPGGARWQRRNGDHGMNNLESKEHEFAHHEESEKESTGAEHGEEHRHDMKETVRSGFPMANSPWMGGHGDENADVQEWTAQGAGSGEAVDPDAVRPQIVAALKTVFDP